MNNKFATETFSITLGNWEKWLPALIIEMEGVDYLNQLTRQINFRLGKGNWYVQKCLSWKEANKLIIGYEVVKRAGGNHE